MITRNGTTAAGWRLDELDADGPTGMAMLLNPFALVPKEEDADRIVQAFELLQDWLDLQPDVPPDFKDRVGNILRRPS